MEIKLLAAFLVICAAGCAGEKEHAKMAGVACKDELIISKSVPVTLSPDFSKIRYVAKSVSVGESGVCERRVERAPEHAAAFGTGVLIGGDRGEWGGELLFRDASGKDTKLLDENVVGIRVLGMTAYVFTGLSHLGSRSGGMYSVQFEPNLAAPQIKLTFGLDAPPSEILVEEHGRIRLRFDNNESSEKTIVGSESDLCFSLKDGRPPVKIKCDEVPHPKAL